MLAIYDQLDHAQRKVALATVVYVEGSAYRRPGARMLVSDDGLWEGAISGGCLERDALRKVRQVMLDSKPIIVRSDRMGGYSLPVPKSIKLSGRLLTGLFSSRYH